MIARFRGGLRRRLLPHAVFFLLLWPLGSAFFAALSIGEQSVAKDAAPEVVLAGSVMGMLHLAPEFLWLALLLFMTTAGWFSVIHLAGRDGEGLPPALLLWFEPLLFTIAFSAGLALEFPAVLRHSLFRVARTMTVLETTVGMLALVALIAGAVGAYRGRIAGALAHVVGVALVVLLGWSIGFVPHRQERPRAHDGATVVFGIDSLPASADLTPLRRLSAEHHGTWYERAVTPALMTNSVWTSILMNRLPQQTGVFLIYQEVDWPKAPFNLAAEAHGRDFETWSFFSSQFTSYVGSAAGFDHDRSSPVGWLYLATGFVKDSSIFIPVLQPRLPHLPLARSLPNQEGTFAYDLRQNIRDILTAGGGERTPFVAAHLDYLHAYGYPRYSDLSDDRAARVRAATVDTLQDQSLNPEVPEIEGDPLSLHDWKSMRIQTLLAEEVEKTGFLRAGNRLVLFSDHGMRRGMSAANFGDPKYFHVPLVTFGIAPRDPQVPISLADIPALLGMTPPGSRPAQPPVVQHAAVLPEEAMVLLYSTQTGRRGAGLRRNGVVSLDPLVLRTVGTRLQTYIPIGPNAGYVRTPVTPVPWTAVVPSQER